MPQYPTLNIFNEYSPTKSSVLRPPILISIGAIRANSFASIPHSFYRLLLHIQARLKEVVHGGDVRLHVVGEPLFGLAR